MLFHKKNQINSGMEEEYEVCVLCGEITDVPKSMPLELRSDYLSGAGQLCHECALQNVHEEQAAMENGFVYALPLYEKKGQNMIKRIKTAVCDGAALVAEVLFTLVAAPVIRLSGLDKVDSGPTPEDIEKANNFAEELKRKRSK